MPYLPCSTCAALIPSHVDATLMRMRSLPMPMDLYRSMMCSALSIEACVSKEKRASTSVETLPGMMDRISLPNSTSSRSRQASVCSSSEPPFSLAYLTATSISLAYSGFLAAARMREGFVVASCGLYLSIVAKSPESQTTVCKESIC